MEKEFLYVAPQVEILEVKVEKGFATSGGSENEKWNESSGGGDF